MQTKRYLKMFILLAGVCVLALSLSACTRSLSKGPAEVGSGQTTDFPLPEETSIFQEQVTATQVVEQLTPPAPAATQTPVAPEPTTAPTEAPAQAAPIQAPVQIQPTAGIPETYTLQKGEHPFCIARRFNVNQSELLSLNGLNLNSKVPVGFTLKIPQTGNPFVTERALIKHPATYTVKAGDTIYTIACAFGDVSPDMIALANDLKPPYDLTPGMTLQIP